MFLRIRQVHNWDITFFVLLTISPIIGNDMEIVPPKETVAIARVAIAIVGRGG